MKKSFCLYFIMPISIIFSAHAETLEPAMAIANVRANCGTISNEFRSMKSTAQVNTVITGVGTAAGAGATIAGLAKASVDRKIERLILATRDRDNARGSTRLTIEEGQDLIDETMRLVSTTTKTDGPENANARLEQKSKNLGNLRTGLLAANTATNVAGTIIAASNRVSDDLQAQLDKCIKSIHDLQESKVQAQINNADAATLQRMDNIINACREYDTLNIRKIDTRAQNAAISSGTGAAVGVVGTITSALANTNKVRDDDTAAGMAREKNLNTASNVLAAGATVASGVATVFNAQQTSTLRQAQDIATKCSEALNQ